MYFLVKIELSANEMPFSGADICLLRSHSKIVGGSTLLHKYLFYIWQNTEFAFHRTIYFLAISIFWFPLQRYICPISLSINVGLSKFPCFNCIARETIAKYWQGNCFLSFLCNWRGNLPFFAIIAMKITCYIKNLVSDERKYSFPQLHRRKTF